MSPQIKCRMMTTTPKQSKWILEMIVILCIQLHQGIALPSRLSFREHQNGVSEIELDQYPRENGRLIAEYNSTIERMKIIQLNRQYNL